MSFSSGRVVKRSWKDLWNNWNPLTSRLSLLTGIVIKSFIFRSWSWYCLRQTIYQLKPTDGPQYLHYSSGHPEYTKRSTIHSQTLRLKRLCSLEKEFKENASEIKSLFLKRGYPEQIVNCKMKKVDLREKWKE